ncbi:MAG: hypothetical protein KAV43_00785 [Hadesarchaea archaeon]|nr:hypothetical protein [Hadesarchaea archaeon]
MKRLEKKHPIAYDVFMHYGPVLLAAIIQLILQGGHREMTPQAIKSEIKNFSRKYNIQQKNVKEYVKRELRRRGGGLAAWAGRF